MRTKNYIQTCQIMKIFAFRKMPLQSHGVFVVDLVTRNPNGVRNQDKHVLILNVPITPIYFPSLATNTYATGACQIVILPTPFQSVEYRMNDVALLVQQYIITLVTYTKSTALSGRLYEKHDVIKHVAIGKSQFLNAPKHNENHCVSANDNSIIFWNDIHEKESFLCWTQRLSNMRMIHNIQWRS